MRQLQQLNPNHQQMVDTMYQVHFPPYSNSIGFIIIDLK